MQKDTNLPSREISTDMVELVESKESAPYSFEAVIEEIHQILSNTEHPS